MKLIQFTPIAFNQYMEWEKSDKRTHAKIKRLILAIQQQAFTGIGKPEPLKGDLGGYWSRRITKEHRLVYRVTREAIIIISCKYHY